MGGGDGDYQLSFEAFAHDEDVRGIAVLSEDRIATSSRDKTVKLWCRNTAATTTDPSASSSSSPTPGTEFFLDKTLVGHTSFVGPLLWLPAAGAAAAAAAEPGSAAGRGLLVSGGMDCLVLVWDVESGEVSQRLAGHEQQVTSLAGTAAGDIASASVDKSIRVWRDGQCVQQLIGHESSVLCLAAAQNGMLFSGSGDCTIRCWEGSSCIKTVRAHTDTVRSLFMLPSVGLLSASHDGSVKLWDVSLHPLLELVGHTALVYSVAAVRGGEVMASGSEDGTARVWRDGACVQVLDHPSCVWAVAFLPSGDLVTACADGAVRVWSRDASRFAAEGVRVSYDERIRASKKRKTVGGVNVDELPGAEALEKPGHKSGQTLIVREGDVGVAYSWSSKEYKWERLGEVVDGPSDLLDSKSYEGKQYDYVFDVDIGDGVPVRKLPFNHGDNPYDVADQWLLQQDLPLGYREQVVDFILQSSGQRQQMPVGGTVTDPYTGGQAYVPAPAPSWGGGAAAAAAGPPRFTHPAPAPPVQSAAAAAAAADKLVPKRNLLVFDTAPFDGIIKKIREFNEGMGKETQSAQPPPLALSPAHLSSLDSLTALLKDTSHYHSSSPSNQHYSLISSMLDSWPQANLFPVLDLLRMLLLHPSAAAWVAENVAGSDGFLLSSLRRAASSPPLPANQLTGLRVAVNAFGQVALRDWTRRHRAEVLDLFSPCASSTNKNVRLALATLLLDYSVIMVDTSGGVEEREEREEGQVQTLSAAFELAASSEADAEVRYRSLLAIATLMHSGLVKETAIEMGAEYVIEAAASTASDSLQKLGREMKSLLS